MDAFYASVKAARPARAARAAGGSGRGPRAWRGSGGQLRGPAVWGVLGYAFGYGVAQVSRTGVCTAAFCRAWGGFAADSRHFAEYTLLIEPLSFDEAYLDVIESLQGRESATEIAREIWTKILAETGLTASARISYNKFLAKLASDYRKPNGQFVVRPGQGLAFVEGLAVG